MHGAISLVALALGYKVFTDAHKEKEGLKLLGQMIGVVVMIAAALSMLCGVMKCMGKSDCPMMRKSECSMMGKHEGMMSKTCAMSHHEAEESDK